METDLYAVICEGLDVLIEDFDSGDIGLPIFASKVERILGGVSLYDASNKHGFEWTVLDAGKGFDLYYASDTHRALMQIRLFDGNRYVHALIKHEDAEDAADNADSADAAYVEDDAGQADDTGCGDPGCTSCSAVARIKATLESAGLSSVSVLTSADIPERTLLSFGRLKRDEN
jgi:hypothetical protein